VNRAGPVVAVALVVAVVVAACSGGDDDATTTTVEVSPTTVPVVSTDPPESTSTTVEVTTTVESTTTVPPTTVPEPTTPATSDPTTTTLPEGVPPRLEFPDDPDKQAVVDAAYAFFDAIRAASLSPEDERLRDVLMGTVAEPIAPRVAGAMDRLVADSERVLLGEREPTYIEIWEITLEVFEQGGSLGPGATFDACVVDADVRVRVNADGTETVVDDSVSSAAQTYQLAFVDGAWRVRDIERFRQYEDQVGCG
jgi:hypothetical protein